MERVEELWIEVLAGGEKKGDLLPELVSAGERLVREAGRDAAARERAGALLELLHSEVTEDSPAETALRLYRLLLPLFPQKREYAAAFAACYERVYPVTSAERAFFEVSGFAAAADPAAALQRLERLHRYREGAYVVHASGWGVGKITAVDPFLKQIKVDLEHKPGHRMALDAALSVLEPLGDESFIVLSHKRSPDLARLRDADPVRLVSLVLESFGNPLPLKEIKARLTPDVIEPGNWTRWWNRVKGMLRESGYFRAGDSAPYLVERVEAAISYEGELLKQFERADWATARKLARQAARARGGELKGAWQTIRGRLLELAGGADAVRALEAASILQRAEMPEDGGILAGTLARLAPEALARALAAVSAAEDQRRAVASLPGSRPADWLDVTQLLLHGKSDTLREAALAVLEEKAPERAQALGADLLRSPQSGPEAFCLLLRETLAGSGRIAATPLRAREEQDLLRILLDLLDHLQHRSQKEGRVALKDTFAKAHALLEADEHAFFRRGLEAMDAAERREVYSRLVVNQNLAPEDKASLLTALVEIEPEIGHAGKPAVWEEDCIYTTAAGLARKRDEFRELMEVKLPANFEAIGRAAGFGDLSENAEYTSALEERDHLTKRATQLKADLDKAKTITTVMAADGVVGLGSRVRLRNAVSGEESDYSILGPWDGGPEEGVLSYRSPLGRSLLERREGEEVVADLPGGKETYRILAVRSHFEAM